MTEQQGAQEETVAESQGEPSAQAENQQVPQQEINWKAANETMAQQKQENELLKQQYNQLLQRQQEILNQQQQSQAKPETPNPFANMDKDDVLTVGEFQGVFNSALQQEKQTLASELDTVKKELKLMSYRSQHSDYDNAVQSALKKAETNPALARAIASSEDPHLLAYELGRADVVKQQQQQQQQAETARMLENAQKPGSVSQAQSGASSLSGVDYIMNMSDEEFEKRIANVKRGG